MIKLILIFYLKFLINKLDVMKLLYFIIKN